MGTLNLSTTDVMAGAGVLLVLLLVWRSGARQARANAARSSARLVSLAGRVTFNAGLIVAGQWTVIAESHDWRLLLAVLAVPALFAAYPITRALTVTTVDLEPSRHHRGRR